MLLIVPGIELAKGAKVNKSVFIHCIFFNFRLEMGLVLRRRKQWIEMMRQI